MKKNLKKNFKRWIAFLLAVVLITTTCVYSSDSFLRAEGEGMDVESQAEPASEEVEVTPTEVEDSESESDSDTDESDSDADDFEEEETDEDEEEVSEGEDVETSDEALDEENVEESDVESEETTEEKAPAPGEETGETYSYAIYYYFDGVEDARVEKEDGVLGEKILDADSVEKEVTHNDESYELDRIENGEITEEVGSNVASVYYVLANETDEEEESESEGEFSYEIRFYYDGKEDEDARVEKEDGVLGKKILDTDSIEKEVTHNEKKYSLDKIENKNGKITEDETSNVVSVYYVLKKVSKFEQTLSVSASDGAEITVAGVLPEGAKVKARVVTVTSSAKAAVEKSVAEEGKELVDLKLYDITIWDVDGNEIQPDESVTVTITGADVQGDDAAVYHVEGGNAEKVADVASGNNAQFDAEHFSVYGVAAFSALLEEAGNPDVIKVKKGVTDWAFISCNKVHDHNWQSENTDVAEVTNYPDYAGGQEITGKEVGNANIYCGDVFICRVEVYEVEETYKAKITKNANKNIFYDSYSVGETIVYTVEVENTGTLDLKNIILKDEMSDAVGSISNVKSNTDGINVIYNEQEGTFFIDSVSVEQQQIEFSYEYVVQEEDAGKTISNTIDIVGDEIDLEYAVPRVEARIKDLPNYTVTYILNKGEVGEAYEVENDKVVFSVKANDLTPPISNPTKEGYKFTGWNPEVAEKVTENVTYTAQYERDTEGFFVRGYNEPYDAKSHEVDVSGITLVSGEKIQYYYGNKWLDANEMKKWPKDVNADSDDDLGLEVPVRVVNADGQEIWATEGGEHPYVKITPREIRIQVPNVTKEYNSSNNYSFASDNEKIKYDVDGGFSVSYFGSELNGLSDLGIKRTEANKNENDITTYDDALELTKSVDDLHGEYKNFIFTIDSGDLTITTKEDANALKIELVSDTVSDTGENGVTYDGRSYFVKFNVTLDGDYHKGLTEEEVKEMGIELAYGSADNYVNNPQRNAGTYDVEVTASKKGYQNASSNKATITINPKEVTVTAGDATTVLNGNMGVIYPSIDDLKVDLVLGDNIGKGDNQLVKDIFTYSLSEGITYSNVGKIYDAVTLKYEKNNINPNYKIIVEPGALDVQGTITYKANKSVSGELTGSVPENKNAYSAGESIPVETPDKKSFTKSGATFLGWTEVPEMPLVVSKEAENEVKEQRVSNTITMGDHNIILYAVWAKDTNNDNIPDYEQYQVIYDLNGGDGSKANPKPEDTGYYDAGKSVTLVSYNGENAVKPTKENAVFIGWSANPSVHGQVYEIDPTEEHVVETVTFDETSPTNITVYAVWAKDTNGPEGKPDGIADYLEHSVAYSNSRFGINAPIDNNLYPANYEVTLKEGLSAPSKKEKYQLISFDSWKNDNVKLSTDESRKITFTMPSEPVTFDAQWKYLTISKTVESKEGGYKVGENMLFTITVKNEGDVDLTGIEVSEKLKDAKLVDGENVVDSMQFDLAKGESIKLRARYEVKDTDIQNKELTNTVEAVIGDDKAVATAVSTNDLADVDAQLEVTKEIENQKTSYAVGDTITFKVTVRNIGSVTVKDITVTDSFEKATVEPTGFIARMVNKVREWFTGWEATNTSYSFDLKPNDKPEELTVTYIVQEEDLGHSGYWNVATAKGKSAIDNSDVIASGHSDSITVDASARKVSLQKQVVEPSGENDSRVDGKYPLDSTVQYKVTVSNRGNTTLKEFMVNDQLTYADGSSVIIPKNAISNISVENEKTTVEWNGSGFKIGALARNDTVVFTYTYTVQDSDAGKTINNAVVPGDGIEKEGEGGSSDPITVVEKKLSVTKQVTSSPKADDDKYVLGELVTYEVTIKNEGNVELTNIHVKDQFKGLEYGASLLEGESDIITNLPVDESVTLHYSYKIHEKDLGKTIANIATATAEDGTEGKNPEDQAVITTENPEPQASIEKQIVSVESDGVVNNYQEGTMVKVGDTINYQITVTNTGNTTLESISIRDQMNGNGEIKLVSGDASYDSEAGTFTIEKIEPNKDRNASKTITYSYKVVDKDKGSTIRNIAEIGDGVKDENGNTPSDEKEVTVENKLLEVIKEIEGAVPEDGYNTGDTVLFKVTVTNAGNVELTNIQAEDVMTGAEVEGVGPEASFVATAEMPTQTIDSLGVGESKTLTYQYIVRAVDVDEKETPMNRATAKLGDEIEKPSEPIVIPIRGQEPAYKVEKKLHDAINGIFAGESIAYDIEIENIGNTTLSQVAINDVMSYVGDEESGVPQGAITVTSNNADWVNGQFILRDPLAWGSKVLIQYTYTVTEDDAGKTIRNTAYGTYGPTSSEDVTIQKKSVDVTKIAKTKKDKYALGETIEFEVIVENTGNVELSDIVVNDQMQKADAEADFVTCEGAIFENGEINQLAPNAKAILTYQYTIRENDFGKTLGNKVEAFVKSDPDIKDDDVVGGLNVVSPDPKVAIEKTIIGSGTGEDGKYKVGDTINYQIVVRNTGNTTLDNVIVKDTMSGATGKINVTSVNNNASIESSAQTDNGWEYTFKLNQSILPLDPSKPEQDNTVTISYTYTVKKDDVGKQIGNIAVVDGDDIIKEDPKNPDPIVVEKRELEVTKRVTSTPDDGEAYQLGEKITFEIVVKNAGNVTLNDIIVTDIMEGIEENAVVGTGGNTQEIQQLKAGESITLEYFAYTVKEEALKAPSDADAIKNTVIARAKDGTEGYAETEYLKIGAQNPDFEVAKEVTREGSAEGGRYSIGEAIPYKIVVTNTGNVTLRNIVVKDTMTGATGEISKVTGATWNDRMGSFIINDPIAVGETAEINYSYVVQPEDVGKEIVNVATGKPFNPGSQTITEIEDRNLIVDKTLTSSPANPARGYVAGERITFDVRVANAGNVTLSGISITDEMQNAVGKADLVDANGNILNDDSDKNITLAVGENKILHYSYTVQRGDEEGAESDIVVGGKTIANKAIASINDGKPIGGTTEDTSSEASIDRLHTLTVYYQYADGSTAAVTLTQDFAYGDSFAFTIPAIGGYTATLGGETVQGAVMFVSSLYNDGDPDPVFTVIYNAIPEEEPTVTPTPTPDGEGTDPGDDTPVPPTPPVDEEPEEPVPEPVIVPVVPATVAAPGILGGGAGLVAIGDDPVPLDGVITQDDDGNIVIVPVDEVEVPLANREIDDHKCCILSFLLMLATLVIYSCFTHSMKKRQKKLAELKDQLAEETLKRQLGITDETSSRR